MFTLLLKLKPANWVNPTVLRLKSMTDTQHRPSWVIEQTLDASRFPCCGNANPFPFKCANCVHPMVLCCECDTLYTELPNVSATTVPEWNEWRCSKCDAKFSPDFFESAEHRMTFDDWSRGGLDTFLAVPPLSDLYSMLIASTNQLADYLARNMQSTAKRHAYSVSNLASAIADCHLNAGDARRSSYLHSQSDTRTVALNAALEQTDPIVRAYAILGVSDSLTTQKPNCGEQ